MKYFDEYTSNYDMSIEAIKYKYNHSYRVEKNIELIAKDLKLNEKDLELAKCIGLLHDIGRFEQYTRYHSYSDKYIDHGDFGVEIIKQNDVLKHFNIDKEDYNVVYTAIKNHNKYTIEPNLGEREVLFSKMIRDADKLDILYSLGSPELKNIIREDDKPISNEIRKSFYKNEQAKYSDMQSANDNIIIILSYAYDIYFKISLKIIKEEKYYEKINNRLKDKEKYQEYLKHVERYIEERVD